MLGDIGDITGRRSGDADNAGDAGASVRTTST
jgi:hypothetical protein